MATWTCKACDLVNEDPGRCMVCGASLGSLRAAAAAATLSAGGLALLWIAIAVALGLQPLVLALAYGAVVSGCVLGCSGGRGLSYQLVASAATVLGMLVADGVGVYLQWLVYVEDATLMPLGDFLLANALYDPYTIGCCAAGFLGGWFLIDLPAT